MEASAKGGQLFLQGAQELFSAMGSTIESTPGVSLLTPMTRLTNLAVSTVLEGFQSVSEVPERIMSVNRAMREYATEAGSTFHHLNSTMKYLMPQMQRNAFVLTLRLPTLQPASLCPPFRLLRMTTCAFGLLQEPSRKNSMSCGKAG